LDYTVKFVIIQAHITLHFIFSGNPSNDYIYISLNVSHLITDDS